MKIIARLTSGWHDDPQAPWSAAQLFQAAQGPDGLDRERLAHALSPASSPGEAEILGLEQLFRRRTGGFDDLKQLVGALASMPAVAGLAQPLPCRIDAFAFAFLKGAKNFDLLLPMEAAEHSGFDTVRKAWEEEIAALEEFERLGMPLPAGLASDAQSYLALRKVVSRSSARDERNTLATLLHSGPSTLEELALDLGLSRPLGQRTLAALEQAHVVERRSEGRFAIPDARLPLTLFCLRETMGIEPLNALR
jgi:hypothetical protein